jgi:quercetin dioxygenase-like cupin family protein
MKTKILVLCAAACGAFLLGGGVVLASGFTASLHAQGTIAKAAEISANGIEFSSGKNAQVFVQDGVFTAGGSTGWHTHPGLTVATVVEGAVINHTGCHAPVPYGKGASFVEPPNTPINVYNASDTAGASVVAILIVPEGMPRSTPLTSAPDCTHNADD